MHSIHPSAGQTQEVPPPPSDLHQLASYKPDSSLLTPVELALASLNETATPYPRDVSVHQLFEAQAARTPDAVAMVFDRQTNDDGPESAFVVRRSSFVSMTYAELNRRANQLADYLRQLNVGQGALVGMYLDRSLDLIVASLAILKAGGAYVPLDPSYPQQRLAFMLEDTRAPVVLTQERLVAGLPAGSAQIVCLDRDWETIGGGSQHNPGTALGPRSLAYVIYTSGSTGQPKGVAVPHQAIVRLVLDTNYIALTERDRMAQASNTSFDAATFEIWGALLNGACLVGVPQPVLLSPQELARFLRRECITTMFLTTALFNQIAAQSPECFASLRHLLIGGEAAEPRAISRVLQAAPPERLVNGYGPTESTTFATWYQVPASATAAADIPIGRPLANTTVYILDGQLRPVPPGTAGELYIGGDGLAWGYLNRPDLTAERFVPNPFLKDEGGRMKDESGPSFILHPSSFILYRTGDLVRLGADGQIEFIGRRDTQVKLRGFRIELSEIESVLNQHPHVRQALVLAREDVPGEKRLVAYVVPKLEDRGLKIEDSQADVPEMLSSILYPLSSELRGFLKDRLPGYMVPSAFVLLDALPLTPNGKVDHRCLPLPEPADYALEQSGLAPRTPVEQAIAQLWSQLLGHPQVAVDESFVALGGYSLLAMQLVARLWEVFDVELSIADVLAADTVAGLARLVAQSQARPRRAAEAAIARLELRDRLPLSFAQQRLWLQDQLEPGNLAYNLAWSVRIRGPLAIDRLRQALQTVVDRHDALRTRFVAVDGTPAQAIVPAWQLALPVVDLAIDGDASPQAAIQRLAREEARRPFVLSTGPLLRAILLRVDAAEHALLLMVHHIVFDGWSSKLFFEELAGLYAALDAGRPAALPDLSIQHADYAAWQRQPRQQSTIEGQLGYWKEQLAGAPSTLELPADGPRPAVQTFYGARHRRPLPRACVQALKALSAQEGGTLFMALLAAFQVLLARYTNQRDIVVGVPIANRSHPDIESLIGFFVNMLPLRARLAGDPSFRELLRQMREVALGAFAHQDVPFEKLVQELLPGRATSQAPLFQVMFALQESQSQTLQVAGLEWTTEDIDNGTAQFDLSLEIVDDGQSLASVFTYNTDLFEARTVERMAANFQALLDSVAADPDRRISDHALLTAAEYELVVRTWSETGRSDTPPVALHQLIDQQAARTPGATALVSDDQELTYGELQRRANQLAAHLRTLGVGPEVPVGVCTDRSVAMVVALLAILKAGGAYLPLDPNYPADRLAFMLEDSRAPLVLTQTALRANLPAGGYQVVCLDRDDLWSTAAGDAAPSVQVDPRNLAYVIYTSGSTGRPKGVAITHGNAFALLDWARSAVPPEDLAGVLACTSICFDLSVYELFLPLSSGGTVFLADHALHLPRLRHRERVTLVNTVPSAIGALVGAGDLPRSVRTVNLAGEPLKRELAQRVYALPHVRRVFNLYGPTEDTTYSTWALVERDDPREPSIGRPISNTQTFILDPQLKPVPIGVVGELYLAGEGLARGYLNRPDLTAERFIPNPFADQRPTTNDQRPTTKETKRQGDKQTSRQGNLQSPFSNLQSQDSLETQHSKLNTQNSRLYKTGDLARHRPDGSIEYIGRTDQQVKVRGFRIELGDVESALRQHAAVQETVVLAREDEPGDKRLVAYVVPKIEDGGWKIEDRQLDASETPSSILHPPSSILQDLRGFLKDRLPDYMVPAAFVVLEQLPLTPNGKIDRRALPRPDFGEQATSAGPRSAGEQTLAAIWSDVLGIEQLGVHDNFFALGGHSLLATQVLARVRDSLGAELPLLSLFRAPTIAELAAVVESHQSDSTIENGDAADRLQDTLGVIPAQIEALSAAEIDALLDQLLIQ